MKNMRIQLEIELHKKFKIKALQDDKTLQEKIIELITEYVEGEQKMAKLTGEWFDAFNGSFETSEDVIEFIFDNLDTSGFEDSYKDMGGYGEPNEMFKVTADDKKEMLYNFTMELLKTKSND
jgi:predicted HicB family RNase H-like nuclease